jgi:hypothetical protein
VTLDFVCSQIFIFHPPVCVYLLVIYLISHIPTCSQFSCITTLREKKHRCSVFVYTLLFAPAFPTVLSLPSFISYLFSIPSMYGLHALLTPAVGFGVGNWQPPGSQPVPNSPTRLLLLLTSASAPSLFAQIHFPLRFPSSLFVFCFDSTYTKLISSFFITTPTRAIYACSVFV